MASAGSLGAVFSLGAGHEAFQVGNAGGIQRMGAEKFRGVAGALGLGVGGKVLPKGDGFTRVVAGAGDVEGTQAVCLQFLIAAEAQHSDSGCGGGTAGDGGIAPALLGAVAVEDGPEADNGGGAEHGATETFSAVTSDHVTELMTDDGGELGLCFSDFEDAGVDAYFSAGKCKGVG